MKTQHIRLLCVTICLFVSSAFGQGFVNLDFEQATIAPTPVGGWTYPADPTQCFPGWTMSGAGVVVMYNDLSLGAPAAILMGPNFPNAVNYTPLQGSYSVLLQYFGSTPYLPPTLSQTGLIPAGTESINFLTLSGENDAAVSVDGVNISLVPVFGGRLAGDVSAFAGTVAQLTFSTTTTSISAGYANRFYFDDIQFSTSSVPEPSNFYLAIVGTFLFCGFRVGGSLELRGSVLGH